MYEKLVREQAAAEVDELEMKRRVDAAWNVTAADLEDTPVSVQRAVHKEYAFFGFLVVVFVCMYFFHYLLIVGMLM